MSGEEAGEGRTGREGEAQTMAFAGIVLLLRQLAQQLLEQGNVAEARGLIDGLAAVQAKTQGNLDEGEARFLEDVLYELRMAAVRGPSGGEEGAGEGDTRGEDAKSPPEPAGE